MILEIAYSLLYYFFVCCFSISNEIHAFKDLKTLRHLNNILEEVNLDTFSQISTKDITLSFSCRLTFCNLLNPLVKSVIRREKFNFSAGRDHSNFYKLIISWFYGLEERLELFFCT